MGLTTETVSRTLKTLTGMPAVAMTPKAGAHGEMCGMAARRGEDGKVRSIVIGNR